MKKCIYFVSNASDCPDGPRLWRDFGFDETGSWRPAAFPQDAQGVIVDDAFLPNPSGLDAAIRFLTAWNGVILLDFERAKTTALSQLAAALAGKEVVVPPAYAACPHSHVLIGPWNGCGSFSRWLRRCQARYGAVVLDGAPLRFQMRPGGKREGWSASLPEQGFPCPGAVCLHRRCKDGAILFWDTQQTLTLRSAAAEAPVVVFQEDWSALPASAPQPGFG